MKLKRVIQLPKKNETLTLEMDTVDTDKFLYYIDRLEQRVKDVYDFYEGKVKVPKSTPKKDQQPPKLTGSGSSPNEGTAFDSIPLDAEDFNLFNVEITRIGDLQTGTAKTGNDWQMRSITVKDTKGKLRDLIAWGDHTQLFDSLKIGDVLDIDLVSKVKEYKGKHQYTLGSNTEIRGAE